MFNIEDIIAETIAKWLSVFAPKQRIFVLYLFSALVLAQLNYLYFKALEVKSKPDTSKGFWKYMFRKDIYLHKSAKQDYKYFFLNSFIYAAIFTPLFFSVPYVSDLCFNLFESWWGTPPFPYLENNIYVVLSYTLISFLLMDFAIFFMHWVHHKVPILWQFHKVHHSAEVLTPITLYRMHPLDLFLTGSLVSVLLGLAFAGFFYLTGETPVPIQMLGVNVIVFAFYIMGYNLRHSHIWLSYPERISHIFMSPAQHQIHHSVDPKHFDKNMGLVLSIWDKMFGTLYVPKGYEDLKYGLSRKSPNPFDSVWSLYINPFIWAWDIMKKNIKASAVVACMCLVFIGTHVHKTAWSQKFTLPAWHMEDLTWTEVDLAIRNGYDSVIIPTGGTEQNGAHVILGKHNYIVRYTSGEIAKRLGMTLVAPVLSYVPEDSHMEFSGTLSVPEPVFEQILRAAAESYKAHGFKTIYFIGDSHGNQRVQEKLSAELSKEWHDVGVKVFHVNEYYDANGQKEWLQEQGYSLREIGGHAGIRDTSELLYVHPQGVREQPLRSYNKIIGSNGLRHEASKEYGEKMIELKIEAAIAQIEVFASDQTQ